MHIGILKTGDMAPALKAEFGSYSELLARLVQGGDPEIRTSVVDIEGGEMPESPEAAEGWLITGSRHGVYEDHAWIEPLKAFLRECLSCEVPVVGVCFGHQIMAEAMGGKAVKSEKGWGLGVSRFDPAETVPWAPALHAPWDGLAVHQDQVVAQPPNSTVLMRSDFCPIAALAYGPTDAPLALTVQPHPEFTPDFVAKLSEARLKGIVPEPVLRRGIETLSNPVDPTPWVQTIVDFYKTARARKQPKARAG